MRGHIRRRGKSSWELKFDLGRDPLTGRRLIKTKNVKGTKRDAERELRNLLTAVDGGTSRRRWPPHARRMARQVAQWPPALDRPEDSRALRRADRRTYPAEDRWPALGEGDDRCTE